MAARFAAGDDALAKIVRNRQDEAERRQTLDIALLKSLSERAEVRNKSKEADQERTDVLALPSKPSVAVLPFDNMSGDVEQEYFVDGVVEDMITALSRIPWIFVIARNSTFTYKGQAVDIQSVAKDLGVRYVVEGSVQKPCRC